MCAYEYYTYDDYIHWEGKWELIDGIAYAMAPSPLKTHQNLLSLLIFYFQKSLINCKNCKAFVEMDYKVDEENVLKPDLSILCKEDKEERFISIAPDIIVEVISKSTARRDEKIKFKIYEEEGVKYYILAYPDEKKVKIYKNVNYKFVKEGDFRENSYKFETDECEFEVDFKEVFERF